MGLSLFDISLEFIALKDLMEDEFNEETAHDRGSGQEAFRGRETGAQQPKQNAHRHKRNHAGNAMKNGRYRCYREPDRCQIQIDRSLFFHISYHE